MTENSSLGWSFVQDIPAFGGSNNEDVFLVESDFSFNHLIKSKHFTKTSFLLAVQDTIKRKEERDRLAELPRSVRRTIQLVSFTVQHDQRAEELGEPFALKSGGYELGEIAKALKDPSIQEQSTILDALRAAEMPGEQIVLLNLIEDIPLKDKAMDVVAGFLPKENAPEVRKAAMNALHSINAYKAVDYLIPYLVLNDPQLATVLQDFGYQSYPPQDQLLNIHAVDALKKLA